MRFSALYLLAFMLLLFTSCQKDEVLDEKILLYTEDTFIRAVETDDYINIRVEALNDTTDNRQGPINTTDYCNISFDINHNSFIDSEVDFGYESPTENYDICSFYFLEDDAITHCKGRETESFFKASFIPTVVSSEPHLFWELSIPKSEMEYNRNLFFVVKIVSDGQFASYPAQEKGSNPVKFDFKSTFQFDW